MSALLAKGWQVQAVSRTTSLQQFSVHTNDVVFHLAGLAHAGAQGADDNMMFAVNAEQTLDRFAQACGAEVGQFIWLSSIKVLGDSSATPLAEDAPYAPGDVYAQSKVRGEELLLSARQGELAGAVTQLSIVRPPLVYGAGVGANFFNLWRASTSPWPLPLASARAPRAWLGVDNLVDFLLARVTAVARQDEAIWHVCDNEQSSVQEMVINIRVLLGRAPRLWPVSANLAKTVARRIGREALVSRLFDPLMVDDSRSRSLLSWTPPFSQVEQLQKVQLWYQKQWQ
jgi:UDP-glucose 4-epimerase